MSRYHGPQKMRGGVNFPAPAWTADDELRMLKRLFVQTVKLAVACEKTRPEDSLVHQRVAEQIKEKIDRLLADQASDLLGDDATTTRIDDLAETLDKVGGALETVQETYRSLTDIYQGLEDSCKALAAATEPIRHE